MPKGTTTPPVTAGRPTVAAVIPFYNGAKVIAEALDSVRRQTRPMDEIIVVDDASRPEDADALDRAAGKDVTVIHRTRNRGASATRNVGIAAARSEWIAFLDCDDTWDAEKTEKQLAYIAANPDCQAVHCSLRGIDAEGNARTNIKRHVRFEDLMHFPCPVFPSCTIVRREALMEAGLFNPTKRNCNDLDLFLRLTYLYDIHCVPDILVTRRVQPESLSRNTGAFWRDADRVFRDYRSVFPDQEQARETLLGLHATFVQKAIYGRDVKLLRQMLPVALRHDVNLPRLAARVASGLIRNKLRPGS